MTLRGHWEFPGGKLEAGESIFDCIIREIDEELSMSISPMEVLPHVFHDYGDFQIELHPVLCEIENEAFVLREHADAGWFAHDELPRLKWAPADLPIVNQLIKGNV